MSNDISTDVQYIYMNDISTDVQYIYTIKFLFLVFKIRVYKRNNELMLVCFYFL